VSRAFGAWDPNRLRWALATVTSSPVRVTPVTGTESESLALADSAMGPGRAAARLRIRFLGSLAGPEPGPAGGSA
jgi:hypothetical protein